MLLLCISTALRYPDYQLLYTRVMYKNFLAVMYVRFMVTPDEGYFTRNMYSKQYNVDT